MRVTERSLLVAAPGMDESHQRPLLSSQRLRRLTGLIKDRLGWELALQERVENHRCGGAVRFWQVLDVGRYRLTHETNVIPHQES
jgi:hypothetical protein